jgi:proteasome lid subunit RPN8/RPN11
MIRIAESLALGADCSGVEKGFLAIEPAPEFSNDRQEAIRQVALKLREGSFTEQTDLALMATLCCLRVGGSPREFSGWVLCDDHGRFINAEITSVGGYDQVCSAMTEEIRYMLSCGVRKVIHFHTHPNGAAQPSEPDLVAALQRLEVLRLVGISLIDAWIVVAPHAYVSLAEQGVAPFGPHLAPAAVARYLAWHGAVMRSRHGLLGPAAARRRARPHRLDQPRNGREVEDPVKRVRRRALALVQAIDMLPNQEAGSAVPATALPAAQASSSTPDPKE